MKVYVATPVNGRKEKTLLAKQKAAEERIDEIIMYLEKILPDAEFVNPVRQILIYHKAIVGREAAIMGTCVRMVMLSDMIVLDDGWECSQGCTVERFVAMQYGKQVKTINSFKLEEKLNKLREE